MQNSIFVILGGGTAGWLTALFIKKTFPSSIVKLIQNSQIDIIGVGEATTPNIINFLNSLDINPYNVLKETKGAIKSGINFENWNGDGKRYMHSFSDRVVDFYIPNIFESDCQDFYLKNLIKNKLPFEEYLYCQKLAYNNLLDIDRHGHALHFDTNLFSKYLQKIGKQRNIEIIEGNYESVKLDENGFIQSLRLDDDRNLKGDFFFDCSGFSRLLIGNVYKEKWKSYAKHLPMKKGIPFWLEPDADGEIQPYTSAIAMKYGWIWKIPLQHRSGSGYIFDSNYIDENQALDESEKYFGNKLEVRKTISFEAGRYQNFWVKNCMAIGLSSSFIEPLESTSIFLSVQQLETLKQFLNEIEDYNEYSISLFNKIVGNNMEDTLNFVYFHYLTKRKDSEFWKNFRKNYPPPEKILDILELIKSGNLRYFNTTDTKITGNFSLNSFLQVAYGLEIFEKEINIVNYENIIPSPNEYKTLIAHFSKKSITHKEFLRSL
jgi:hypothetical protein